MGELLLSWQEYNKLKKKKLISTVLQVPKHWDEVCVFYEMHGDGAIWKENPIKSPYPPLIAFKEAQIKNTDKAILF